MAARVHGQNQLGGETAQQPLQGIDGRLPAPRFEGEEVHLLAEEDAEQQTVRGDHPIALDADAQPRSEASRPWQGRH